MTILRIQCLGDFRVELDNKTLSNFETEKSRALLAYLAVESGRAHRRSHLAGLLWSEESEEHALHNLRQTLTCLRKALGDSISASRFILADRDTIQLNPSADVWVDVQDFRQNLACAYRYYQSQKGRGLLNIRCLMRALSLFQGPFLSQFYLSKCALFDEWTLLVREDNNLQAIKALSLLADYHERRAEYQPAIQAATRIVELAPWDEGARAQLIRLLAINQQWSAAQSQYIALQKYLSEQLGVPPTDEVSALFQQIRAAASGKHIIHPRFPPERYHLPDASSSFVGRESDLENVMELIVSPENRLITLAGPGGIGKTRLALEIAHQLVGVFPDGVFFVSFIAAQTADQINQFIAEAIGLFVSDQVDPQKQLISHLRDKALLLVLDNFEHLLADPESTKVLDDLLKETSRGVFLVTSRERLNLRQERLYALTGLNYPQDTSIAMQTIKAFDALTLFTKRAVHLQREFYLNEANLPSVIRICRVLEGMPLGVELAAASLFELGHEAVATRIESDLDVLTSNISNVQARHRSLRAAFEVSWELLTTPERDALCKLSVFRDGFDRSAALQIAHASASMLSTLVSKSLLRHHENDRFSLHEAIRQFVAETLAETGSLAEIRARHAHYYVSMLAEKNKDLKNAGQMAALADIQQEFGNASLAWTWLVENHRIAEMIDCMDSLFELFNTRSQLKEGMLWFEQAIQSIQGNPQSELAIGMLLSRQGALAYTARENTRMFAALQQGQELLLKTHALRELAYCQIHLGWAYHREKDFSTAQEYAEKSLTIFTQTGDILGESQALTLAGAIQNRQGYNTESKQLFEQALTLCRKTGNQRLLIIILNRLGDLDCYDGRYENAVTLFSECLRISEQLNDQYNQAILLNNLGTIHHIWKDYPQAQSYYQKSLAICREIGDQDGIALALNNLGELATVQGDYPAAIQYSENALKIAEQLQENWTIVVCLNSLGEIYNEMDMLNKSRDYFLKAIQLAVDINGIDLVARVSVNAARVVQRLGDPATAIALLQSALAHSSTEPDAREKAVCWLKEMNAEFEIQNNDQLLIPVVKNCLNLTGPN